jgi:aminoglycoside 3'-phosphotransferase II
MVTKDDPTDSPPAMPSAWAPLLSGYSQARETIGRSAAATFRLEAPGRPTLFAKAEAIGPFCGLAQEAACLQWLKNNGIPCPNVLAQERARGWAWLLVSALPGRDLASSPDLAPETIVGIMADALRALHRLDVAGCPFDRRLDHRIAVARSRLEAGIIDEGDFEEEYQFRTAASLFEQLLVQRPGEEDVVVAHGDACLPNFLARDGRFTGFVDCGRLGIADRHQDLALATRSIRDNLDEEWAAPFLSRYGLRPIPLAWPFIGFSMSFSEDASAG